MINLEVELMMKTALRLLRKQGGGALALKNEDDGKGNQIDEGQQDGA
jgi:hypothetical protein